MRILAVDDDELIRDLLVAVLASLGRDDVVLAPSGQAAIEMLKISAQQHAQPFDCIFLDINMPGMDGIEACGYIRKLPQYSHTPIIMLTAMSDRDFIDRAFTAGATDYVTKPFDILELETRLNLAERLRDEIELRRAQQRSAPAHYDLAETFSAPGMGLADDIGGFLVSDAFENYISSLSKKHFYTLGLWGVRVENIRPIHRKLSPEDFSNMILLIARAISVCFVAKNRFFTYAGSGIFICTHNRGADPIAKDLDAQVQVRAAMQPSNETYEVPRVLAGAIKPPGIFSTPGEALFLPAVVNGIANEQPTAIADSSEDAQVLLRENLITKPRRGVAQIQKISTALSRKAALW